MNPLISVIVPVYNVEKYLNRCIDSIICQTYTNLEIFLIDDGSFDNCPQICDEYAIQDRRIKVVHKNNGGQGSARNMALDVCKGEYISFVDSDDWIKVDMIEVLYRDIINNNAQLAVCGMCTYNGIKITNHSYYNENKVFSNKSLIQEYISKPTIHTGPCNKLYHRSLFCNVRFPNVRAREDVYIMHEVLSKVNKAIYVKDCKYIQYIRQGSTEQSGFNSNKLFLLECAERLQSFIKENYSDLYIYVEYKYADEIINLLKDLISSFSYFKYKKIYIDLNEKLSCDIQRLLLSEYNLDHKKFKRICFVYSNSKIFFMQTIYQGIVKIIRKQIKRMLIKTGDAFVSVKERLLL